MRLDGGRRFREDLFIRPPEAPAEPLVSADVDVYCRNHPGATDLIEGSIGDLSPLHETYGHYAQSVGQRTVVLLKGWEARLVPVPTSAVRELCLELHDLVISKYVARREKDRDYVRTALRRRLVTASTLLDRLAVTPVDPATRERRARQIDSDPPR